MNEMNQWLQTITLRAAQTQQSAQSNQSNQSAQSSEPSEFERLMREHAADGRTEQGWQTTESAGGQTPAAVEKPAESPEAENGALEMVSAMMSMLAASAAPVQVAAEEPVPETVLAVGTAPVQTQEIAANAETTVPTYQTAQQAAPELTQTAPEYAEAAPELAQQAAPKTAETAPQQQAAPQALDGEMVKLQAPNASGSDSGNMEQNAEGNMEQSRNVETVKTADPSQKDSETASANGGETTQPLFRNVESVPVKVGELPVADTQSGNLDAQLAGQIGKAVENGNQTVTIQLSPENLGTVVIDLTRTQDGALEVVLHTNSDKAAGILSQNLDKLGAMLQNNSQSDVQVSVRRGDEAQQFQQQNQQQDQQDGRQQRQQERSRQQSGEDFLQQLRLGLITVDGEAS